MTAPLSVNEFRQHLHGLWDKRGFPLPEGDWVGVSIAELAEHSRERNANLDLPYVDLWVAILDEYISWFVSLYSILWGERGETKPLTNFEKSMVLILGKVVADLTAIRHLVLAGFDTSARTILRSLAEYLEVLVAVVHQPALADSFVTSDTPEGAQLFWETYLRGGRIRRRVTAAWMDLF